MKTQAAKIFMNGQSQAVRLPKEYCFDTDEVYISRQGHNIIISAKKPAIPAQDWCSPAITAFWQKSA